MYSGSFLISRPPSGVTWFPNFVARKIFQADRIVTMCYVFCDEDRPYLVPLSCSLKPPPKELLTIAIERSRVPVHAPKLKDSVKELEALLVRRGYSVECFI